MEYLSWNRIGIIDLTTGTIDEEELDDQLFATRIGGAGITKVLYERFENEDPIVIGTGYLTGSLVPGASLGVITAKSPLTGKMSHAPFALHVGAEMKYSGFDYLVVKGVSERPVYLWVRDGLIDIEDATKYWGLSAWEIIDSKTGLRDALGDELIQFLNIGPAGEQGIDIAQVMVNCWASGDIWGFGKVFGRKKLKSLALRGMGLLEISSPEPFIQLCGEILGEWKGMPGSNKGGCIDFSASFGEDLKEWAAPLVHRHVADSGCPYPMNTFLKHNEDPTLIKETPVEEPGILVTDLCGLLGFKDLGLSVPDCCRMLDFCTRFGVNAISAAKLLRMSNKKNGVEELKKALMSFSGPFPVPKNSPFSSCSPPALFSDGFGVPSDRSRNEDSWKRRQAVAYIFGIHPIFILMHSGLTEGKLLELTNLASGFEITLETLETVISDIIN
jgi:aldehyde:ferredoxin oxidoreductase